MRLSALPQTSARRGRKARETIGLSQSYQRMNPQMQLHICISCCWMHAFVAFFGLSRQCYPLPERFKQRSPHVRPLQPQYRTRSRSESPCERETIKAGRVGGLAASAVPIILKYVVPSLVKNISMYEVMVNQSHFKETAKALCHRWDLPAHRHPTLKKMGQNLWRGQNRQDHNSNFSWIIVTLSWKVQPPRLTKTMCPATSGSCGKQPDQRYPFTLLQTCTSTQTMPCPSRLLPSGIARSAVMLASADSGSRKSASHCAGTQGVKWNGSWSAWRSTAPP